MPFKWSDYSLEELRKHAIASYRQGGGSRPDVLVIEIDGQQAVLKDHNKTDKAFSIIVAPLLVWRETKALTKLKQIDGIPELFMVPDKRSILMEHIPAEQIVKLDKIKPDWEDFYPRLVALIEKMHATGVAHCDLRSPTNTLITAQGEPVLVDLVACYCKGENWNIISNWIFGLFCKVDLSAVTKLKSKTAPHLLNDSDVDATQIAGGVGMLVRRLGQLVRIVSRQLFTAGRKK